MNRLLVKHDRTETPADGKGAFMLMNHTWE